ncbi:ABC transporter ATP-binding protein [Paracoccus aminophilus]|uniref:ABC-type multidrug transport system, ATPase component n=1 Tax=Paracoccus aminophilus JCM 7686 TaxID=1367847 RepID=S5Y6H2_PARAH|nr:ABC transporter ATP-binding protein [Paracoccus aminophilus]AGT11215.1 ABC-type multidrug transport system, ATPase component [Paracoccus aminophilus JCM 7686]
MTETTAETPAHRFARKPGPAVRVEHLTLKYGSQLALDDVSLTVARGSSFALLGPNGAGKTSLMSVLATLLEPGSGTVEVAGHDVRRASRQVRLSIGMVFQDASLDDRLSAEENLDFHGLVYGMPARARAEAIDRVLELVELTEWREAIVRSFSGGMKRRLEIARALMHDPEILFLDEPTVGLDAQTRSRIWAYLNRQRAERGLTLLTTTHYIEEVEDADFICIIDKGKIISKGSPAELKQKLGQAFLHVVPASAEDREALLAAYPTAHALGPEAMAIPAIGEDFVASFLARFGNRLREMRYEAPTLEGVFLGLTGRVLRDRTDGAREAQRAAGRRAGRR